MKRVMVICFMGLLLASVPASVPLIAAQTLPAAENRSTAPKAESASDDEASSFKHSPSVQWLARNTGMSVERTYQLSVLANFAVIALAIVWLSKKNLPAVFRNRNASIQRALQEARQASEEANRRLADIEARLSRLDSEIEQMRAAAETDAAANEERIKAEAEEDARHIADSAGQEIAAAAKAARRELTAYAADLAVSLAARQVKIDGATDQSLVRNFAEGLSPTNGAEAGKT